MVVSANVVARTIRTFERAADANRATPNRRGNVIEVTASDADDVMITADLHGNRLNFDQLIEFADLKTRERRHLVMQEVCHGGPLYPSGTGCMSHLLLEDVAQLKVDYPERFHFLLSNHEWAELTDFPITKSRRMLNLSFRSGMREMYGSQTESVRAASLKFIESCPLAVRVDERVFACHSTPEKVDRAGFDSGVFERPLTERDLAAHGPVFQLIWGRDFRAANAEAFARLVNADVLIHGHEPCAAGFDTPNKWQIILDCCGADAGFVVLPTGQAHSQSAIVAAIRKLDDSLDCNR